MRNAVGALTRNRFARRWIAPGLVVLGMLASANPGPAIIATAANPIVTENQQFGTSAWQIGALVSDDATGQIKGYASATSVAQGQTVSLYITVNPIQTYSIDVYRIGWYQGLGGRAVHHAGPLLGLPQAPCPADASTGMIACNWAPSYSLSIPATWTSGVYLALLTNSLGYQNYIVFVVTDGRPAPLLVQTAATTYAAYNNWPDDQVTGKSLYSYNSYGPPTVANDVRAVKVSFDRPYTGDGSGQFLLLEVSLIRWLERSGYDVTYTTDVDTETNGSALRYSKGLLSTAHDEYWSSGMYDAWQRARDAGVNLAFLGANAAYWQIRFEPSAAGVANRVIVCYKDAALDPVKGPTSTVNWRDAPANRPEQGLMGVQFTNQVAWGSNVNYIVTNSANWVYAGTGFKDGDQVPGLVGYEMDRLMTEYPAPTALSQTLLSRSPYTSFMGIPDYANSSIYQAPSRAWVFAAGTTSWSWALDNFGSTLADARIQQTTANVLNTFQGGPPALAVLAVAPVAGPAATPTLLAAMANTQKALGLGTSD